MGVDVSTYSEIYIVCKYRLVSSIAFVNILTIIMMYEKYNKI